MSAWNPAALHEMALPPCHLMCQVSSSFFLSRPCAREKKKKKRDAAAAIPSGKNTHDPNPSLSPLHPHKQHPKT
jgi:hypothetical protein